MIKDYFIKNAQIVPDANNKLGVRIEYFKGEDFYLHYELVFAAVDVLLSTDIAIPYTSPQISADILDAICDNFGTYINAWAVAKRVKPLPTIQGKWLGIGERRQDFENVEEEPKIEIFKKASAA